MALYQRASAVSPWESSTSKAGLDVAGIDATNQNSRATGHRLSVLHGSSGCYSRGDLVVASEATARAESGISDGCRWRREGRRRILEGTNNWLSEWICAESRAR